MFLRKKKCEEPLQQARGLHPIGYKCGTSKLDFEAWVYDYDLEVYGYDVIPPHVHPP
jgi:hypothetical protein